MSYFIVTYDLVRNKDYDRIESAINKVSNGVCKKILETVWVIRTSYTKAGDLRDFLAKHIDSDDELFVVGLGDSVVPWAATRIDKDASEWLKSQR